MKMFGIRTTAIVIGLAGLLLCPLTFLYAQIMDDEASSFEGLSGELNFPRAMFTERAYLKDEVVFTTGASLDGTGSISNEFVYEKRLGTASQLEIAEPFIVQEIDEGGERNWASGVGDVVVGLKRAFFHSLKTGSILSAAAELKIPTGDDERQPAEYSQLE